MISTRGPPAFLLFCTCMCTLLCLMSSASSEYRRFPKSMTFLYGSVMVPHPMRTDVIVPISSASSRFGKRNNAEKKDAGIEDYQVPPFGKRSAGDSADYHSMAFGKRGAGISGDYEQMAFGKRRTGEAVDYHTMAFG